jgi:hypothetical protein
MAPRLVLQLAFCLVELRFKLDMKLMKSGLRWTNPYNHHQIDAQRLNSAGRLSILYTQLENTYNTHANNLWYV